MSGLRPALEAAAGAVERVLSELIPDDDAAPQARLFQAMRHATLGGGKRLRPFLLLQSAGLFGARDDGALRAAAAVEMVHCYSLAHDDLPAMDDDDVRRGRPATHVAFDEATAILAGDALLALAFEVLADPRTHADPAVRSALVLACARAAGPHGMVGGQTVDLASGGRRLALDEVAAMQRLKTGALFRLSCDAGALLGGAGEAARAALASYAAAFGLAFQIADDLLDADDPADADGGRATFVSLLGADGARTRAGELSREAVAALSAFDSRADPLREAAGFAVSRRR